MGIKVRIHPLLAEMTEGMNVTQTEGKTVGECLEFLQGRFPNIPKLLNKIDDAGLILVCLNDVIIYPDELDSPVNENDEITLGVVVAGG